MFIIFHIYDQKAVIFLNKSTKPHFLWKLYWRNIFFPSMNCVRRRGKMPNTACVTFCDHYCNTPLNRIVRIINTAKKTAMKMRRLLFYVTFCAFVRSPCITGMTQYGTSLTGVTLKNEDSGLHSFHRHALISSDCAWRLLPPNAHIRKCWIDMATLQFFYYS